MYRKKATKKKTSKAKKKKKNPRVANFQRYSGEIFREGGGVGLDG